jgi:ParB-like chromosome segregation protein Spo0J
MSREDELRDVLDKTAKEISLTENNPRTWLSWIVYLLGRLEQEAITHNPDKSSFNEMLSYLLDVIRNRQKTGGW